MEYWNNGQNRSTTAFGFIGNEKLSEQVSQRERFIDAIVSAMPVAESGSKFLNVRFPPLADYRTRATVVTDVQHVTRSVWPKPFE